MTPMPPCSASKRDAVQRGMFGFGSARAPSCDPNTPSRIPPQLSDVGRDDGCKDPKFAHVGVPPDDTCDPMHCFAACILSARSLFPLTPVPTWLPVLPRKSHIWSLPELVWSGGRPNSFGGQTSSCGCTKEPVWPLAPFKFRRVGTCPSALMLGTGSIGNGETRSSGHQASDLRWNSQTRSGT